ncbi:unnamed protein product [Arctia plantaginis]|uniref:C2H2-type domain-containing protein n=1 Tax=Arctia plantaginis TaxID=874455 RepID=A0A8S0ZIM2_ARCPL|nr:unnamed protein product [Arctia plantaginis]
MRRAGRRGNVTLKFSVEGGYHCLTCNVIVSENCIIEHLKSAEHNSAIVKKDLSQYTHSNEINAEEKVQKNKIKKEGNSDLVKEKPETKTLTSKKSSPDENKLSSGPLLMKEKPVSSKSITQEMETFAKHHGLSVNKFNHTVYCRLCSSQVPATMNCVKEHVLGKKHKDNSLKHSSSSQRNKKNIKKINMKDFITRVSRFENLEGMFIIINEQFYLKSGDFFGVSLFSGKLVCQFCHIDLNEENLEAHIKSTLHKNLLENSFVITSLEDEFVRQVKSDLYHCGYCGVVESDFDEMLDHLATTRHKMCRAESEKILQRLKMEEFIRFHNFMAFLAHF